MSVATLPLPVSGIGLFPAAEVEACLRKALTDAIVSEASMKSIAMPGTPAEQMAMRYQIDSLTVVELLCAADKVAGFELKQNLVRPGGYESVNEAIHHLMPRIEAAWKKHKNKGGKK